jgi:hypothetical protein
LKKLLYILFLFCPPAGGLFAQEKTVQGIVFDMESKQRLNRVYIYNTRTGEGFYNNTRGELKTNVIEGDVLVAALQGYAVDTVSIKSENTIIFYLRRNSIQLREVIVRDSLKKPGEQLKETQEEYRTAYTPGDSKRCINNWR